MIGCGGACSSAALDGWDTCMNHGCCHAHTPGGVNGGCGALASRTNGKSKLYVGIGVVRWLIICALLSSDRMDGVEYDVCASLDAVDVIVTSDDGGRMECCMEDHSIPVGEGNLLTWAACFLFLFRVLKLPIFPIVQ